MRRLENAIVIRPTIEAMENGYQFTFVSQELTDIFLSMEAVKGYNKPIYRAELTMREHLGDGVGSSVGVISIQDGAPYFQGAWYEFANDNIASLFINSEDYEGCLFTGTFQNEIINADSTYEFVMVIEKVA